jgi:hypothetical protein
MSTLLSLEVFGEGEGEVTHAHTPKDGDNYVPVRKAPRHEVICWN